MSNRPGSIRHWQAPVLAIVILLTQFIIIGKLVGFADSLLIYAILAIGVVVLLCALWPGIMMNLLYSSKLIRDYDQPVVFHLLSQQARLLNMKTPCLLLAQDARINAFAVGGKPGKGMIVLNASVLEHLNQDEVESVIAHEVSHIAHGHALAMTLLQFSYLLLFALPLLIVYLLLKPFLANCSAGYFIFKWSSFIALFVFPVSTVFILLFSRRWEYQADVLASKLIGKDKVIAALRCLHGSFFQHINVLSSSPQSRTHSLSALLHPTIEQRINHLKDSGETFGY